MTFARLVLVFAGLFLVGCVAALPDHMNFLNFIAGDPGASLSLDQLAADGRIPGVDFGYTYGLLSVASDRGWFAVCGRTPWAVFALTVAGGLVAAVCYASTAAALRFGLPQLLLLVAAFATCFYPGQGCIPIYVLESCPLIGAMAAQARGRLPLALALATVAVLMKPALGYVYGLILLGLWAGRCRGDGGLRRFALGLLPAAVVGGCGIAALSLTFGPTPVVTNLLPTAGASSYHREGFGLFGAGKSFWAGPPGATAGYFLGTIAGAWLVGSAILLGCGLVRFPEVLRRVADRKTELLVTCAALHGAFLCTAFGHANSWAYYFYFLAFGLACAWPSGVGPLARAGRLGGWLLIVLFAISNYTALLTMRKAWQSVPYDPQLGLFARPETAAEWARIRALSAQRKVFVFTYLGGARQIEPSVDAPESWCLFYWQAPAAECNRVLSQLSRSDILVIPKYVNSYRNTNHPANGPIFADEVAEFDQVEEGESFIIRTRSGRR
jgi:hypothetical protein